MSMEKSLAFLTAAAVLVAGCVSSGSGAMHRHTLYLDPPQDFVRHAGPAPSVRVDLPRYIEDQYLLQRSPDGSLQRLEGHVWAESPDEGFARLLREHLAARGGLSADRLQVRLTRFDAGKDAMFYALGDWQLRTTGRVCARGYLGFQSPLSGDTATALLHAMNEAVAYTAAQITPCEADATHNGA